MTEKEEAFDDAPIIQYANRLQKHMFLLTEQLSINNTIEITEKRRLRLLIQNLPPKAKEILKDVYDKCMPGNPLTTVEFDEMYGKVSDWIYINILQDAFRARPISRKTPHIGEKE